MATSRSGLKHALTDLEAAALGFLATSGPSTPYAVRQCFLRSPSARFSGSAGAVYPMLRRLEDREFVSSRASDGGRRGARVYSLTTTGRRAVRAWLMSSFDPSATFADDPFRTRIAYVQLLSPRAREQWLDSAETCLRDQLDLIAERHKADRDSVWKSLAHDNARRLTQARLAWLKHARQALEKSGDLGSPAI